MHFSFWPKSEDFVINESSVFTTSMYDLRCWLILIFFQWGPNVRGNPRGYSEGSQFTGSRKYWTRISWDQRISNTVSYYLYLISLSFYLRCKWGSSNRGQNHGWRHAFFLRKVGSRTSSLVEPFLLFCTDAMKSSRSQQILVLKQLELSQHRMFTLTFPSKCRSLFFQSFTQSSKTCTRVRGPN